MTEMYSRQANRLLAGISHFMTIDDKGSALALIDSELGLAREKSNWGKKTGRLPLIEPEDEEMADDAKSIVVIPEIEGKDAILKEVSQIVQDASDFSVATAEDYELSVVFRQQVKTKLAFAMDKAKPVVEAAFRAHQAACKLRDEMTQPYLKADEIILGKQMKYNQERERIDRERKAAAQAEARRIEEEQRQLELKELKDAGETKAAEELAAQPLDVPQVHIPSSIPKVAGAIPTKRWIIPEPNSTDPEFKINVLELAKYAIENPAFAYFLLPNVTAIRKYVIDNKGNVKIPGVPTRQVGGVSIRK